MITLIQALWLGVTSRHCGLSNWVRHNPPLQAIMYIIWQSKHLLHLGANYKRLLLSGQRNYNKIPPLIRWSSKFSPLGRRNIKVPLSSKRVLPWPALWAGGCTGLGRFRKYIVGRNRVQHTLKVFRPSWRYVEQLKIPEKSQLESSVHWYYTYLWEIWVFSNLNYISQQYFLYWHKTRFLSVDWVWPPKYKIWNSSGFPISIYKLTGAWEKKKWNTNKN